MLIEKQLMLTLEQARTSFKHSGLRGDQTEAAAREFINRHLPNSSSVGTGEAIDSMGGISRQTDIIITNSWHPFRYNMHEPGLYVIEGISAAGEVKSCLTTKELKDSLEKGSAFKKLKSIASESVEEDSSTPRENFTNAPYFLFAFESKVAVGTLVETLHKATIYDENGYKIQSPIDAVFILGKGACIDYGDGSQGFQGEMTYSRFLTMEMTDWCWHPSDHVLTWLLSWLHETMEFKPDVPSSVIRSYLLPYSSITGTIRSARIRKDVPHVDIGDPRTWPNSPWSPKQH
ncbi:DUF6602 domain-containing protein [Streptosporangium subroseum]|uniref:DUF6602 domain-containing protein n=1 Tax=Streptosporangium subroseum TaxID=106412 RepID=UPI00341B4A26